MESLKGRLKYVLALILVLFGAIYLGIGSIEINTFLFIAMAFLFTFFVGHIVEKIRVPWIFAALLLGSLLAFYNPFETITSSDSFVFLAQLGMYFLLFIIGFEINLGEMMKRGSFIVKSTIFIIFLEGIIGTIFITLVFGYDPLISFIVALSFATVGEALLVPILHEFKMINTPLGQTIIGVGTLDDVIEVLALIMVVFMVGAGTHNHVDVSIIILSLVIMFLLTFVLMRFKKEGRQFKYANIESIFLFSLFVLFLFLGVGMYADTTALAALLAGIALGNFLPKSRLALIEKEIKAVCYGLFAPLFFIWVGSTLDIGYVMAFPLLIIAITLVSNGAKILGSLIMGRKEFGIRRSIILGVALSVRFSTSIIIVKILFDNGIIGSDLYSVIVASTIVFKFLVPVLLSYLLQRWGSK